MNNQEYEKKVKFAPPAARPKAQPRDLSSNTMVSSKDVNTVLVSNVVRENALACEKPADKKRKKRDSGARLFLI